MTLKVQYPLLGRRTLDFDVRAKWFTAIYDEIRRRIPTEVLRLYYVPVSRATAWTYRIQMLAFESRDAVTHITTQMHAFLLRRRPRAPTVITCYDLVAPWTLMRLSFADRVIVPRSSPFPWGSTRTGSDPAAGPGRTSSPWELWTM